MCEIFFFIIILSLYIFIPFLFLAPRLRKKIAKKVEEQSSIEELKQNIKIMKGCIIVILILLGVSFVHTHHYIITLGIISFININLWQFLIGFFFIFYVFLVNSIIKEKEKEKEK